MGWPVSIANRFRVHKAGPTVQLHGVITDTTKFTVIDEMLAGTTHLDCGQLLSASWNGIIKFDKYLRSLNVSLTLTNIPNHIFNYLRLMPEPSGKYELDQVELSIVEVHSLETKKVFLSTHDLRILSNATTSAFLRLDKNREIIGKEHFICPDKFRQHDSSSAAAASAWYGQNHEQFDFWYDYCNFTNTTGILALDLVHSLQATLKSIITEIGLGVKQSEDAIQLLEPSYAGGSASVIDGIVEQLDRECNILADAMITSTECSRDHLLKIQLLASDPQFSEQQPLYQLVSGFCENTLALRPLLPNVEEIGANTGAKISGLAIVGTLRKIVEGIPSEQVSASQLEEFRDVLEIMDPLSEDSWDDTKECFFEHIQSIDHGISDAVILLQGFDLLRQILEHRFAEADTIGEYLAAQRSDWSEVRKTVFALVNKTLVTDQEKYSCEFFIPKAAESETEKHPPGEVLLF